ALIGLLTVTLNAGVRLRHLNLPLLRRWRVGRHLRDEALVQFLRGILAGHFQLDLEGGDFHEPREVASGPDGNDDVRNIHAQNLHEFLFHADTVHVPDIVPRLEGDDQVEVFVLANAFDAKHGGDVDNADAAHFHVITGEFRAGANHVVAVHEHDLDDVISDKAVTAFDKREDGFAFADAALAADDDAHAEDVHHAAQFGAARREHGFELQRRGIDEFHRHQRALEDRHLRLLRRLQKFCIGTETAAEDDARDFVGEQIGITRLPLLFQEGTQVIHLRVAHDLHTLVGEVLREPAQREAGPVHGRLADDALQTRRAGDELHLQHVGVFLVKLINGDGFVLHAVR